MPDKTSIDLRNLLKFDLRIRHDKEDDFLDKRIDASIKEIQAKGIVLDLDSSEDQFLVVDYTSWKYKTRYDKTPMPEHLKLALRNGIVKNRSVGG